MTKSATFLLAETRYPKSKVDTPEEFKKLSNEMPFGFDKAFFQKLDAFLGVLAVKRPSQPHPKPLT